MTASSAAARLGEERRYLLIRPTAGAGYLAAFLIALTSALGLVEAWTDWNSYFLHEQFEQGGTAVGVDDLAAAEDLVMTVYYAMLALYALTGISFIVWLFKARRNSEILCTAPHRRPETWVGWGWVVPVVNLWYPFQVVRDIWKASSPTTDRAAESLRGVPGSPLLALWWGCWWAAYVVVVVGTIALRVSETTTLDELRGIALTTTASAVVTAVAGVSIIICVRQVIRWQSQSRT